VRRDKAALFQRVQAPPGNRSSRKQLMPQSRSRRNGCAPAPERVTLPVNGWRSIRKPAGMSVRCLRGRVTITQEGDPRDSLLVAGESCDVARNELLYVQAQREAELRFAATMAATKTV
jgi:hypothetical protein